MAKITFLSPLGDDLDHPDVPTLKELVLNRGQEYWNAGSGEGGINWTDGHEETKLRMIFFAGLGFYLVYVDSEGTRFVSLGSGDFDHTVTPYVGGDPVLLPTKFFVPPADSWVAVREFCATGQRSLQIAWAKTSELPWDYGMP